MGARFIAVLALLTSPEDTAPKVSADVVEVTVGPGSLADGLETYYVGVKVKDGWSVYANPGTGKADATAVEVIEFLADAKRAGTNGIVYPKGKPRRDAAGKAYQALTVSSPSSAGWCTTT